MSSLVAYASSDDSDSDDAEFLDGKSLPGNSVSKEKSLEKNIDVEKIQPESRSEAKTEAITTSTSSQDNNKEDAGDEDSEERKMFKVLPTPSKKAADAVEILPEDELEDLVKPKKSQMASLPKPLPLPSKRVKISIPSLDYDSEEEDNIVPKRKPKFSGSSNLLDILPAPIHMSIKQTNRTLIPYTLGKKPPAVKKPNATKSQKVDASKSSASKILTEYNNSDEDEDMTNSSNFFSLDTTETKTQQLPYSVPSMHTIKSNSDIYSVPLPPSNVMASTPFAQDQDICVGGNIQENMELPMYPQYQPQPEEPYYQQPSFEPQPTHSDQDLSNMDSLLQDEQFLRLQGKNQRGKEKINIVDVNTDDFIDPSELTKTLTQEMPKHSYKKNKDAPSKQSKNKHQITYLAYQAKEMELELKNQWSQNKMTKRQTQAKYGF